MRRNYPFRSSPKAITHLVAGLCLLGVISSLSACGPTAVRGDEVPGLDDEAFSTGLDRRDLEKLLNENLNALQGSAVIRRWEREERPTLTVLPFRNETSEHVDGALQTLISEIETKLINAGHVRVINREMQPQLIDEIRSQYSDAFDQTQIARWGRQIGARYFITGKVFSNDERSNKERRVQYSLFLQVIDAETSETLFQNQTNVTKALIR